MGLVRLLSSPGMLHYFDKDFNTRTTLSKHHAYLAVEGKGSSGQLYCGTSKEDHTHDLERCFYAKTLHGFCGMEIWWSTARALNWLRKVLLSFWLTVSMNESKAWLS